ncbi:TPA: hypothetical protein N0F65_001180, partial [Lagenidium giganteum]
RRRSHRDTPTAMQPQGQIFRDTVPVVDLSDAARSKRSWEWVCSALVNKDKGDCSLHIIDSVFIQKQQIWSWYYSTPSGVVRRKSQRKLTAVHLMDEFARLTAEYDQDQADVDRKFIAICRFTEQGKPEFFTSAELATFLKSLTTTANANINLWAFVRPRGDLDPTKFANLELEYSLTKSGRPQSKLFRMALGGQRIASMDAKLNSTVDNAMHRFVSYVEKSKKCRVVQCLAQFVIDEFGRLLLWRTDSCDTMANPAPTPVLNVVNSPARTAYEGPHAVNERLLARAKADATRAPNEKIVEAIMASPTPHQRRQHLSGVASLPTLPSLQESMRTPSRERDSGLASKRTLVELAEYLPSTSTLSRGRRRSVAASHLMSSQKKGCSGDYCDLVLTRSTNKQLDQSLQPAQLLRDRTRVPVRSNSVITAMAAANEFLKRTPPGGEDSYGQTNQQGRTSPQKQSEQTPEMLTHTIPFKLIAQTRAEKQLVDLFLRRYQKGEDGDYLAEDFYGDGEPLGENFPGYYYQEMQVCAHCFEVYTLIEGVRMKAREKVARSKRGRRSGIGSVINTGGATPSPSISRKRAWTMPSTTTVEERDERDEGAASTLSVQAQASLRAWAHAVTIADSLSKTDTAELYSFASPHPAICMVFSALGCLFTGRTMEWQEAKRLMSQEKLLLAVKNFTLDKFALASARPAADYARNPLFSPEHIAPISHCAGKFCEWILSVVQAFAWKHRRRLAGDGDVAQVLCFRKPELLPSDLLQSYVNETVGDDDDDPESSNTDEHNAELAPSEDMTRTQRQKKHQRDAARRAIQEQQMARLSAPAGLADSIALGDHENLFTCQDGVTKIPYTVTGQAVGATTKCNLVVFHDFFDTMDSTKVFFRAIVAKHVGSRVLLFNLPGQAGTTYPTDEASQKMTFNNVWNARKVHELLNYLQHTKKFITAGLPFHIVGFGNGANVATCYTILFGKAYEGYLRSLVLLNGFARVDSQMAAILHSTLNVFSCFPPTRPDLPVSLFCKFLFSEAYLAKIDPNLALSIYTAVTNAISLDGRLRVCQGALHHMDLVSQLCEIHVPLVLVQSVENALVAPTNVDPYLQGRSCILHAWSHQQNNAGELHAKSRKQLRQVLETKQSAFVSWLRAGHELRQESKKYLTDLFEVLVSCLEEPEPIDAAKANSGGDSTVTHDMGTGDDSATDERVIYVTRKAENQKPTVKSAFQLQLDQSDKAFQEALRTHEAQKAGEERQKWLSRQQPATTNTDDAGTGDPTSTASALPERSAVSPAATEQKKSRGSPSRTKGSGGTQGKKPRRSPEKAPAASPNTKTTTATSGTPQTSAPSSPAHAEGIPAKTDVSSLVAIDQEGRSILKSKEQSLTAEIDMMRQKMRAEERRLEQEAEELRRRQRAAAEERMRVLKNEQERRRKQWEDEDKERLAALEKTLQVEQDERNRAKKRLEQELAAKDLEIIAAPSPSPVVSLLSPPPVTSSALGTGEGNGPSSPSTLTLVPDSMADLKKQMLVTPELPSIFDEMEAEEKRKKRVGMLEIEAFEEIKTQMKRTYNEGVRDRESSLRAEMMRRNNVFATRIQKYIRRYLAIKRVTKLKKKRQQERVKRYAGGEVVRIVRGFLGRRRFRRYVLKRQEEIQRAKAATAIQKLSRGFICRLRFIQKLQASKALMVQRVYRGHRGRAQCRELREYQAQRRFMDRNASKIQSTWKMHVARDRYLTARFAVLAAVEIQRIYRGHLGRQEAHRKKQWKEAEPGPERLALGLKLIEGSKQAFERQQSEIDALHRAQESVERQVSTIHAELVDSEKELAILERELQEIDQLEMDLKELTHEAEMLHAGGIEGLLRNNNTVTRNAAPLGNGIPEGATPAVEYEVGAETLFETKEEIKKRQAEAYALEMAIQIKRSEREKKKKDLEAEFTSVFAEVQQKRAALGEMEEKLADMEATRMRKDREFARLQRNLMELLEEQKLELENLREKGIELEAATATSAAAAVATAMKAKEHEKRSQAMFESTEELMKFQFMSMSLSYFSSLNMLKSLRDINADTTAAAVTSTAETAAAAAAAAAAANVPAMKRLQVGGADLMTAASKLKKDELERKLKEEEDVKNANVQPLPQQVRDWNVDDVGRWLDMLSLSQYKKAFQEGAVDGEFLLELRPEDMSDVLGVSHKLHVRKIIVARNKLLPLSAQEQQQIDAVMHEEGANAARQQSTVPDLDTVFSQARNGRLKRLQESIDAGFDINAEDEKGNTLLLIACQNVNVKMVEYLVSKRANVNHKNVQGNTPLHFAMAYDTEGALGEYLIGHGADDSIENTFGLTPYDGLQPS